MDHVTLHSFEPLNAGSLAESLRAQVDSRWLHRWAGLDVAVEGPWRPADHWPGALERLVWTAQFHYPEGAFFTPEGEAQAGRLALLGAREAPIHPAELLGGHLAAALVLWHSDAGRSAYASLWRERRFRWSLRHDEGVRIVRCDGERVIVESPPRHFPEADRTGVLLAGWQRFLNEPLAVEGAERLLFVDDLAALTAHRPWERVYGQGAWGGEPAEPRARAAALRVVAGGR